MADRPASDAAKRQESKTCGYGYSLFCKRPGCALGLCQGQRIPTAKEQKS